MHSKYWHANNMFYFYFLMWVILNNSQRLWKMKKTLNFISFVITFNFILLLLLKYSWTSWISLFTILHLIIVIGVGYPCPWFSSNWSSNIANRKESWIEKWSQIRALGFIPLPCWHFSNRFYAELFWGGDIIENTTNQSCPKLHQWF